MARGRLEGRRALVTGAARGIGLATAKRFCDEGAAVALADIRLEEVKERADELVFHGTTTAAIGLDVSDEASVESAFSQASAELGGLDVLVANAGVVHFRPIGDEELDPFQRVVAVNLVGVFLCFRAAARLFREQRRGVILATASQAGRHGYPSLGAYCASKFGVIGLVEALAKELGPHGVRVNCVAPGLIGTDMYELVAANAGRPLTDDVPLRRIGTPEEVAEVFAFLASERASYVSGATISIDGGEGT
jgi:NAD(P)-dependent dehydrogenase (short-subunit alcohol dehydrogenase family)